MALPRFSPDGGSYASALDVTITCDTPGVTIRYTTNGLDPTVSSTSLASGDKVRIDADLVLKARAWKTDWVDSLIKSASYTLFDARLAITSPAEDSQVTSNFALLQGTAATNAGITAVEYRLENSEGVGAYLVATGTSNWSATVTGLIPGTNVVRVRAVDALGQESPSVTRSMVWVLPDVIAQCSATLPAAPTMTDASEGLITGVADVSGPFDQGDHTIRWTYTDSQGNSTTQTQLVKVHDTEAPVANEASLLDVTAQCSATMPAAPTATDACEGLITGVADVSGPFDQGDHTITWTYTDSHGNSSTQTQWVKVHDTEAPVANAASLLDVTAQCSATLPAAPTATDACEGPITGVADVAGPFGEGDHTITWTFTDSHGNSSTRTQLVKVHDTIAPVANAASLLDVTAQFSATLPVAPTATDACEGPISGVADATGPFGQGDHTITWTFTDSRGNSSTQTQLVKVIPPQLVDPVYSSGAFRVSLATVKTRNYFLEFKNSLTDGTWITLRVVAGDGTVMTLEDLSITGLRGFYRVRVE